MSCRAIGEKRSRFMGTKLSSIDVVRSVAEASASVMELVIRASDGDSNRTLQAAALIVVWVPTGVGKFKVDLRRRLS
jgi:hypothetical protein